MTGAPTRPRRRGRLRWALALVAMVGSLLLTPSSAAAWGCEAKPAPTPSTTGTGVDSVLNDQAVMDRGDVKGFYENFLMSGTEWHVIVPTDSCTDEQRLQAWPILYNIVFGLAKGIDMLAIEALRFAVDPPLDALQEVVVGVVGRLREGVWEPLLPSLVILGAVTLAWWGLVRKRSTLTFEGAVWMIAATTLGLWVLGSPASFINGVGNIINFGTNLMNSAVVGTTEGSEPDRCIPGSPAVTQAFAEDDTEFLARQQSEYLWEALVCRPWIVGQFGSGETAQQLAGDHAWDLLYAQAFTRTESVSVGVNVSEDGVDEYYDTLVDEKQAEYERIAGLVEDAHTPTWDMFRGSADLGGDRAMAALVALGASLTGGLLILAAAFGLLVCKLGLLLLMLAAPIFFLFGIHPGRGRTILLRWWELLAGLMLQQLMWQAVVLILVLVLNTMVTTVRPYGLSLLLMCALVAAVLKYKNALWGTLTHVSFSGDTAPSQGGGYSMTKDRIQRAAIGAVQGAAKAPFAMAGGAAAGAFKAAVVNPAKREVNARRAVDHENRKEEIRADDATALQKRQEAFAARYGQVAPDRRAPRSSPREYARGKGGMRPTHAHSRRRARAAEQAPERKPATYIDVIQGRQNAGVRGNRTPDAAPPNRRMPYKAEADVVAKPGRKRGGGGGKPAAQRRRRGGK
ncbi:hypothetical protein ACOQFV_24610 [Nocardiopsis changdeensis]|uniref:TrbL/VirB6 plasmid conjugal transfer protein n=1 Tax=Nocardiopsis changdeensis TaxID=2831969 RepID=A0A975QCF5_9ACTN|nr:MULTISPECIES: hypothetical protein [Nocardiopsis]QUX26427.1 hypothetical protein KGD84_32530 [Nocardiopsis changdeensis]QYX40699.1 hypothetical protein K1J57_32380 [Nocardiopsis sp. MT53]